jgi:ankyrin repeat domain-containing protein 50
MNLHNEHQIPRDVNHHLVCKFDSTQDSGYGEIIGTIREIFSFGQQSLSKGESALLSTLCTSRYESHRALIEPPVKGTCEWFLKHETLLRWLDDKTTGLLWVSGGPGCGKSVLTSFLIGKLERNARDSNLPVSICYFFFDDKVETQKSAHFALCAILHQLVSSRPSLIRHVSAAFQRNGPQLTKDLRTLWSTVLEALSDSSAGSTIMIVLDAADECESVSRQSLLQWIVGLMEDTPAELDKLKFLITSRPEFEIQNVLRSPAVAQMRLEDEVQNIEGDISMVVLKKLEGLGYSKSIMSKVTDTLMDKADGTFLWVSLVLRLLEESGDSSYNGVMDILDGSRGNDLHNIYAEILSRVPERRRAEAKRILQIAATSSRPFSLAEFNLAIAILPSEQSIEHMIDRVQQDLPRFLLRLCGPFIRILADEVHLVHQTAKEFLLKASADSISSYWMINPAQSQRLLAEVCLWYLFNEKFNPTRGSTRAVAKEIRDIDIKEDGNSFLEYSATHWPTHFREGQSKLSDLALQLAEDAHDTTSSVFKTWFPFYWKATGYPGGPPRRMNPMISAAMTGHYVVIQSLSNRSLTDIGLKDSTGSTALLWACRSGHPTTVSKIIGLDPRHVNEPDSDGRTPLWWASWIGNATIVNSLLRVDNIEVYFDDSNGRTPLLVAAWNGHDKCVERLLLHHDTPVDKPDSDGSTPLAKASSRGHRSIVQLLLDNPGVKIESKDKDGRTPLARAAQGGHTDVLKLLLRFGDPNSTDKFLRTALSLAAEAGHVTIVKALLKDTRTVADSIDEENQTPLYWAAGSGHDDVVHMLAERSDVNTDSRLSEGQTPLSRAAENGYASVVQLLLSRNDVDVNSQDDDGKTPLSFAATQGHSDVVRLLVAMEGIDLNRVDDKGRTPLMQAVEEHHLDIVSLLCSQNNVNINAEDKAGHSALDLAARRGKTEIIGTLLTWGDSQPSVIAIQRAILVAKCYGFLATAEQIRIGTLAQGSPRSLSDGAIPSNVAATIAKKLSTGPVSRKSKHKIGKAISFWPSIRRTLMER